MNTRPQGCGLQDQPRDGITASLTVMMVIQLAVQRSKKRLRTQWGNTPTRSNRNRIGGIPITGMVTLKKPNSR